MQKRSEITRLRLLEAALQCFAEQGYAAAGVAEICQAAQVSKGAFYHHFPSKQDLFLELLHGWLETLDVQIRQAADHSQTVPESLVKMAGTLEFVFSQASSYLPMFLEFWLQASRNPLVWAQVIAPYQRYQDYFQKLIEQGISEGSLRPVDPSQAARLIVAAAVGLLLQAALHPERSQSQPAQAEWAQAPEGSIQLLLKGLAQP